MHGRRPLLVLCFAGLAACGGGTIPRATSDGLVEPTTTTTASSAPPADVIPTLEASIPAVVHGAGESDVLNFMVAHRGQIVHLFLDFKEPPYVNLESPDRSITVEDDVCGPEYVPKDCGGLEFLIRDLDTVKDSKLVYEHGIYLLTGRGAGEGGWFVGRVGPGWRFRSALPVAKC